MNPEPWNEETLKKYRNLTSDHTDKLLDNGYGSCVFRHSDIRKILSESLWYYHGKSYYIDSYVIMPNHLHILVRMIGNTKVHEVFSNIKNYTARLINARLQLSGRFWQRENFDRIVRSEDAYKHYRNYIINNPRNLPNSQYELYY
ncbi:MAG: transposase [Muribaculaceae bacterium]|nr:transposase [Muribaculaceae bacterium]